MSQDKAIETTLNLSIDANQSQNFFSRLHQNQNIEEVPEQQVQESPVQETPVQETPVQETPVQETSQNIQTETIDFLNKINSTEKIMGHNKFQQKIEELENELNIYKKYNTEQDMKINLFKKTISNLQMQLQEKSNQMNQNSEISIYVDKITDLTENLKSKTDENNTLLHKIVILEKDLEYKNIDLSKIKDEYFTSIDKLALLNQSYTTLELKYQSHVNDIQNNKITIHNLEKQLNLETTIKSNLESELSLLKKEVSEYRNNINNIKLEKDNEISILTEQINNLMNSSVQSREIKKPTPVKKEPIVGRPRGTNLTTRGTNRTR